MTTVAIGDTRIEELVRRIVEAVHPLRIILFGSAAGEETTRHSDLDVMVIMPEGTAQLETAMYLHGRMSGLGVPVDIVVATPGDLERYGKSVGMIYREVLREGREIYAAGGVEPGAGRGVDQVRTV